jgi:hypothetical protein
MKKFFILAVVLCVASASAMTAGVVKTPYTPPTNAYWQIIDDGGDNVLACVLEGQEVYGNGDDCRIYNTDTMDFTTVTSNELYLEFDISLVNDDPGDHCILQMRDAGDSSWTTFEDFDADTAGYEPRSYDLVAGAWGDWTVYDSVYTRFRWQSDDDGTSDGVRVNNFNLYSPGMTIWEQYLEWTSDHSPYGPGEAVNLDISELAGSDECYVNFHYDDEGIWAWWCEVDQVVVSDDTRATILTEDFESWPPDDYGEEWEITELGSPGYIWKSNSMIGRSNYAGYSGYCADADSDAHYPGGIDSEMISPAFDCSDSSTVELDFIGAYNYIGSPEYFEVLAGYEAAPIDFLFDDFEGDLSLWTVVDQGSGNVNIEERSLGTIKGMFH